ncbi:serine/threonine-protein kinase [Anaeromyxobacter oryzae]|uniref:Serine/threonine protein kinase n=1 Tax=Anaeromyxobacter oryzae TaxID=2918170 RepID=A0ABN6MYX2_9BACT|nr:serine/threonine-protein kinase [Anaeromyxobacter oryzae]BDG05455.1 serine/threonine protein kinase [Anaeromyxobacter oryzae]
MSVHPNAEQRVVPGTDEPSPGGAKGAGAPALSVLLRELVSAPAAPMPWAEGLYPGRVIGRFELVRELGRGGFGVVFEARDRELGRSVAFKAVYPGTSPRAGEQLLREAEAIAQLQHPNLVTLFDVGRCALGPFLVLELLRGRTLKDRIELGPIPVPEVLAIAMDVAAGLAHAHAAGVVHRDLKPSNVFLCESGAVKVLDFGMAHAFGRQRVSGGTPAYMAPEQWREEPDDARTDVFALGVLLHEMLSGDLPFGPEGEALRAGTPAPRLEVPGAPALPELVACLLELDPARRPRDAADVLDRLRAIAAPAPGPAARRRLARITAAVLASGLLAGAVALTLHRGHATARPAGPRTVAVLPFASLSASQDDAFFADGVHGELITQLARLSGLRVIARGSVQQYPPGARDLRAIGAALGADTILEGTVQRAGDRARIAVQLVDPRSGTELWANRFDRAASDVFAIQTEVALEIAGALGATLSAAERRAITRPPTRDREAHDLFLRGLYYWQRSMGVESDNRTAEELLEKAAARDPAFALAEAWLAAVTVEWKEDCDAARRHAAAAAALEPDLPQLHVALAEICDVCDHDTRAAIRELEHAVRAAPGDATARALLGTMRTTVGAYDAGLDDLRLALALDPRSYLGAIGLARELVIVRRFDEAERACDRARELAPGDVHGLVLCALVPFWRDGDLAPARHALDQLPRELPSAGNGAWSLFQLLAVFPDEALRLAAQDRLASPFSSRPLIPRAYVVGAAHAARGEPEAARAAFAEALPDLEARARAEPTSMLAWLFLARAEAGVGRADEALRDAGRAAALASEPEHRASAQRFVAEIAAAAGRPADAVDALREVLARPDGLVTPAALRVDPRFAPLRGDPRFDALVVDAAARQAGGATPRALPPGAAPRAAP